MVGLEFQRTMDPHKSHGRHPAAYQFSVFVHIDYKQRDATTFQTSEIKFIFKPKSKSNNRIPKDFDTIKLKNLSNRHRLCSYTAPQMYVFFLNTQIIYDKFAYAEFPNSTKWYDRK